MAAPNQDLAAQLLPIFPDFGKQGRHLVVSLFALLARGYPVGITELAEGAGWSPVAVRDQLSRWWGIRYDDDGCIIGFWGLDLLPTRHHLRVGGRDLFAWCAWDTLFLPGLLGEEVAVHSRSAATGDDILLRVAPEGVLDSEPDDVRLSFLVPDAAAVKDGVRAAFCCHVGFLLGSRETESWLREHPGSRVLSLEEGFALGREVWLRLLGEDLFPQEYRGMES